MEDSLRLRALAEHEFMGQTIMEKKSLKNKQTQKKNPFLPLCD